MKRFTLCIVILLLAGTTLLYGANQLDFVSRFSPTKDILISTTTATVIFSANGNRRDLHIENDGSEATTVYIDYDTSVSTHSATTWELHTTDSLTLEYFTGAIYGISINTTTVSGYELTYE